MRRLPVLPVLLVLTALLALAALRPAHAQDAAGASTLQFASAAQEQRFHALTGQLRCVMCQNESLADSQAPIAHDLRRQVLELMNQGRSDEQIKAYLVERYGQFVLYRPQVEPQTWLLWFGPPVLLLAGAAALVWVVGRRRRGVDGAPADDGQEW